MSFLQSVGITNGCSAGGGGVVTDGVATGSGLAEAAGVPLGGALFGGVAIVWHPASASDATTIPILAVMMRKLIMV